MKKPLLILILIISALISRAQTAVAIVKATKIHTGSKIFLADQARISRMADTAFAHEQWQLAFDHYSSLINSEPKSGKIFRRLGYIYSITQDNEDAIPMFNKAIEIDNTDKVSYYELGIAYISLAKSSSNNSIKAKNKSLAEFNLKKAIDLGSEEAKGAIKQLNGI